MERSNNEENDEELTRPNDDPANGEDNERRQPVFTRVINAQQNILSTLSWDWEEDDDDQVFQDTDDEEQEEEEETLERPQRPELGTQSVMRSDGVHKPSSHSYLWEDSAAGEGARDTAGFNFIQPESVLKGVPLYPLRSTVVFPGDHVPLIVEHSTVSRIIERGTDRAILLAVTSVFGLQLATTGTLVEVRSFSRDSGGCLRCLCRGMRRFTVQDWKQTAETLLFADIKVLREPQGYTTSFPWVLRPRHTWKEFGQHNANNQRSRISHVDGVWYQRLYDPVRLAKQILSKMDDLVPENTTGLEWDDISAFQEDIANRRTREQNIMQQLPNKKIQKREPIEIKESGIEVSLKDSDSVTMEDEEIKPMEKLIQLIDRGQIDFNRFSYWIASNLPVSTEHRQKLLEENRIVDRLKQCLKTLNELGTMACKSCGAPITTRQHIFHFPKEGAVGTFVNAHGIVHQIMTTRFSQMITMLSEPTEEHSWFPGYAWTIINCAICGNHLGWRFDWASLTKRVNYILHLLRYVRRLQEKEGRKSTSFFGRRNTTTSTSLGTASTFPNDAETDLDEETRACKEEIFSELNLSEDFAVDRITNVFDTIFDENGRTRFPENLPRNPVPIRGMQEDSIRSLIQAALTNPEELLANEENAEISSGIRQANHSVSVPGDESLPFSFFGLRRSALVNREFSRENEDPANVATENSGRTAMISASTGEFGNALHILRTLFRRDR